MTAAYQAAPWTDLAVGITGAAAALTGLLFVAVSINLDAVIAAPHPARAAAHALIMLVSPVFVGVLLLIPEQPPTALGTELAVLAAILAVVLGWFSRPNSRAPDQPVWSWSLIHVVATAGLVAGLLLAGIGLLTHGAGGLYWIPEALAAALLGGLANAWTLLVEVRRPD